MGNATKYLLLYWQSGNIGTSFNIRHIPHTDKLYNFWVIQILIMVDEEEIPLDSNTGAGDELQKPHKHISLGFCRKQQGYSVFGHCCMLVIFLLSLILIVALMYWMD